MFQCLLFAVLTAFISALTCEQYLQNIALSYVLNPNQTQVQLAPYVLLSGKAIDDLGFPDKCVQLQQSDYITVQFMQPQPTFNLTVYMGLCFNSSCNAADLNQQKGMAVEFINNFTNVKIPPNVEIEFVQSSLDIRVSTLAIVMLVVFSLVVLVNLGYSLKRYYGMCVNDYQSAPETTESNGFTFEQNEPHLDEQTTALRKISFEYKFQSYLCDKPQSSDRIVSFSVFKLFCVPMIIYGQEFYFRNFAANNYYAFDQEIYSTFYSKVAMFSVYLPDVLFFISGFLLAKKCLQLELLEGKQFAQFIGRKLYRLYPFYIVTILIYATISPSMHAGPVWYVYENQVDYCGKYWWRSMLLIGNWWEHQCYAGGWFVQAEIQLVIVCLIFFAIFLRWKRLGILLYAVMLVAMIVVTFVLAPKMPVSLENTLDTKFFRSFTATYNYLLFYLLGIGMALLKSNRTLNEKFVEFFDQTKKSEIVLIVVAIGLGVLVLMRPSIWSSASGVEFTLCRIGVFICFLLLFLTGIFRPDDHENSSRVHQVAYYSFQVMLFTPVITLSSVWGVSSFSYVSAMNQLNLLVTEFILAVLVGVGMGILVEYRFGKR